MPATKVKQDSMKMPEIKEKARALGITPGKMKKAELVRFIQIAEGYTPCFGRSEGQCGHVDCCFMRGCLRASS